MVARRADRLSLVEKLVAELRLNPELSGNELQRLVGARRRDVQRALRALRAHELIVESREQPERPATSDTRFPLNRGGSS
jgi:hypothetical protein